MISQCDVLRVQYERLVRGLVRLFLAIARSGRVELPPKVVRTREAKEDPETGRTVSEETVELVPRDRGEAALLLVTWGPYFNESSRDKDTRVATAATAKREGLVRTRTAVKFVADLFGVTDI